MVTERPLATDNRPITLVEESLDCESKDLLETEKRAPKAMNDFNPSIQKNTGDVSFNNNINGGQINQAAGDMTVSYSRCEISFEAEANNKSEPEETKPLFYF